MIRSSFYYSEVFTDEMSSLLNDVESSPESLMKRNSALFLMKTKNEGRLTQSALKDITNGTSDLCQQALQQLKRKVSDIVDGDWEMQPEKKKEICTQINAIEMTLFEGLDSEHKQEKYYRDNFGYMVGCTNRENHL